MLTIPIATDRTGLPLPAWSTTVALDGVVYRLTFVWNIRGEFFTLSLATEAGVPLLAGVKLVLNEELILRWADGRLPPGALAVFDTTEKLERVGRADLGSTVVLVYLTFAELEVLRATL